MGATPEFGFPFPDDTDLVIQAPQQFENLAVAVEGALETVRDDAADASNLTSGTLPLARVPALPADQITSGTLGLARIPSLPAGQVTSGTFAVARIPSLAASQITSGTFAAARIPALTFVGTLNSGSIASGFGNINIGSSTFTGNGAGISNLQAGNLAGTIASARLSGAYTGITGTGTLASGAISSSFGNINIGSSTFTGNGSGLSSLNASNLASGTVPNARISGAYSGITTLTTSSTIRSTGGQVRGDSLRTDSSLFFNTTGFPRFETSGASVLLRGAGSLDMRFDGGFRIISGELRNDSQATFLNAGDVTAAAANVNMAFNGRIQRSISSARYKRDIKDADVMPSVLDVRPVTFRIKSEYGPGGVMYGVIAEELHELGLTHLVEYADGQPESVHYPLLAVALIPHVKDLAARVAALEEGA